MIVNFQLLFHMSRSRLTEFFQLFPGALLSVFQITILVIISESNLFIMCGTFVPIESLEAKLISVLHGYKRAI